MKMIKMHFMLIVVMLATGPALAAMDEQELRAAHGAGTHAPSSGVKDWMEGSEEKKEFTRQRLQRELSDFPTDPDVAERFVDDYFQFYQSFFRYLHLQEAANLDTAKRVAANRAYSAIDRSTALLLVYAHEEDPILLKELLLVFPPHAKLFVTVTDDAFKDVLREILSEAMKEFTLSPYELEGRHASFVVEAYPYIIVGLYRQRSGDRDLARGLMNEYPHIRKLNLLVTPRDIVKAIADGSPAAAQEFVFTLFMLHDSLAVRDLLKDEAVREIVQRAEESYRTNTRRFLDSLYGEPHAQP